MFRFVFSFCSFIWNMRIVWCAFQNNVHSMWPWLNIDLFVVILNWRFKIVLSNVLILSAVSLSEQGKIQQKKKKKNMKTIVISKQLRIIIFFIRMCIGWTVNNVFSLAVWEITKHKKISHFITRLMRCLTSLITHVRRFYSPVRFFSWISSKFHWNEMKWWSFCEF